MSITVDSDVVLPDSGVIVDITTPQRTYDLSEPRSFEGGTLIWISDHGFVGKCDACTNDATCYHLNQCLRYKCEFGKVDKP